MSAESNYQETDYLKVKEAATPSEQVLCTFHQHLFGLIVIYFFTILCLAASFGLLAWLKPESIKQSQQAYELVTVFVLISTVVVISILIAATYVYRSTKITITNRSIEQILQKGLLFRKVMRYDLVDIEDVTSEQKGLFATTFNFGTLTIETAGETVNPTFSFCPNPNRVCKIILDAKSLLENSGSE
jgi:membrane protein YdbS with pleckstrin-like domain